MNPRKRQKWPNYDAKEKKINAHRKKSYRDTKITYDTKIKKLFQIKQNTKEKNIN